MKGKTIKADKSSLWSIHRPRHPWDHFPAKSVCFWLGEQRGWRSDPFLVYGRLGTGETVEISGTTWIESIDSNCSNETVETVLKKSTVGKLQKYQRGNFKNIWGRWDNLRQRWDNLGDLNLVNSSNCSNETAETVYIKSTVETRQKDGTIWDSSEKFRLLRQLILINAVRIIENT